MRKSRSDIRDDRVSDPACRSAHAGYLLRLRLVGLTNADRPLIHLRGLRSFSRQSYPLENVAVAGSVGRVHQRRRVLHPFFTLPRSSPDHNRYRVVVHRFPVDTLSAVDGHLHANPIFFRTLSNPVSWNIASWPGPCPLSTLIFSRAPSGSDRRSSTASSL